MWNSNFSIIIGSFLSDDRIDIYKLSELFIEIFEFQTILISDYAIDSIKKSVDGAGAGYKSKQK